MKYLPQGAPLLLAILDGVALNPNPRGNAVRAAETPTLDALLSKWPNTTLATHGTRVGLPEGQMGNSEVGHLTIGSGRIIEQDLSRINRSVSEDLLVQNEVLKSIAEKVVKASSAKPKRAVHFIGLLSQGGVHSDQDHLLALIDSVLRLGVDQVFVHAVTDGRDRPPLASQEELLCFEKQLKEGPLRRHPEANASICDVIGRYYAMDRDNRWERSQLAYQLFCFRSGEKFPSLKAGLESRHAQGETDEFLKPFVVECSKSSRDGTIEDGDALIFYNFRADRMRQIVKAFTLDDASFGGFKREKKPALCSAATLTEYAEEFDLPIIFPPVEIQNHFGQVIAKAGLSQLRIAETEKYPHVTYFFNGGSEALSEGEDRILVPSPRDVATYDLKPEMSAPEVTEKLLASLNKREHDVIILNYANCDMVGHTGIVDAAVRAVETVDSCLGAVLAKIAELDGLAAVTADHGNADQMIDYDTGRPHTFHTTYPVPFVLYGEAFKDLSNSKDALRKGGALCDIAPTLCELLGLEKPAEMTGQSLLKLNSGS